MGFPGGSDGKESASNAGDPGLIPGLGRSPEGNGNPLQYSFLDNSMERGAWYIGYSPWGCKELEVLNTFKRSVLLTYFLFKKFILIIMISI